MEVARQDQHGWNCGFNERMKLLIIEDDQRLVEPIKADLEHQKYLVDVAADGQIGWECAMATHYDLLLLDVMLPKLDGVTLCYRLRQLGYQQPILMMTARGSAPDRIAGLDSGADAYLVKPFGLEELAANVRALLRRQIQTKLPMLCWGDLILNLKTCEASFRSTQMELTPTEYRVLAHFMRNPNHTFHPREIIDRLWLPDQVPSETVVKAHINGLRRKLEDAGLPRDLIQNVYGLGYRLKKQNVE